jgi:ADP-heptose:LPS heptosyltransferase
MVIRNNPNVEKIFVSEKGITNFLQLKKMLSAEKFDVYIDMDNSTIRAKTLLFLNSISPLFAIGFNREKYKSYNVNISCNFGSSHITDHHQKIFTMLGFGEVDKHYDIIIPNSEEISTVLFLKSLPQNKKNIVINPFGASKHKWLSFEQIQDISAEFNDSNIIIIGSENDLSKFLENKKLPTNAFIPKIENYNLFHSFAIIANCDFVITPDTSILHCAVAFHKPFVGLYLGSETKNEMKVWGPGPNAKKYKTILAGTKLSDIADIPSQKIIQAAKELFLI